MMIGAVVLAAGGSSRLGAPKQLLLHRGETLVRRAALAACGAGCLPVVIVAGEEKRRIEEEVSALPVRVFHHLEWHRGIGSSIRAGVAHALAGTPHLTALVVMVCDQPFVTSGTLRDVIDAHVRSGMPICACSYADTVGVPALFGRDFFPHLLSLPDGRGAQVILAAHRAEVCTIDFPDGAIDIDTPADMHAHLDAAIPAAD